MTRFPDRNLNQTAVYWGTPTSNGIGGFTYAAPVEISCRWVEKREVITDQNGDEIVSNAQVQVSQNVDEQGKLYLGTLDDLDSDEESDPITIEDAFTIRKFDKTPTMQVGSVQRYFRKAYL